MASSLNALSEGDSIYYSLVLWHLAFWDKEPVELGDGVREGNLLAESSCLLRIA